jgi:hypothetical protein
MEVKTEDITKPLPEAEVGLPVSELLVRMVRAAEQEEAKERKTERVERAVKLAPRPFSYD